MATSYKVLGQVAATSSNSTLYTVPALTQAVVSTISVCNTESTSKTYRIQILKSGVTYPTGFENYIAYDATIPANDTKFITVGITLAAGDIIQVRSSASGTMSIQAFGSEIA